MEPNLKKLKPEKGLEVETHAAKRESVPWSDIPLMEGDFAGATQTLLFYITSLLLLVCR